MNELEFVKLRLVAKLLRDMAEKRKVVGPEELKERASELDEIAILLSKPRLTLEQQLKLFDPVKHGGEVMADRPVGNEII